VPGVKRTAISQFIECYDMIPQSTCIAGEYELVTAYDGNGKYPSVIYVKDHNSQSLLTTLNLGIYAHVGGITYSSKTNTVYVSGASGNILSIPLEDIKSAVEENQTSVEVELTPMAKTEINCSFLTCYSDYLFVGAFDKANDNIFIAYKINDDGSFTETSIQLNLPIKSQGIAFVDYNEKTYLICSCSYGRTSCSKLYVYETMMDDQENFILGELIASYTAPNMSEGIYVEGETLRNLYESCARKYQYNNKTGELLDLEVERFPLDNIIAYSVSKLIPIPEVTTESVSSHDILDQGMCGEEVYYTLYKNGDMVISGNGEMDDYASSQAPYNKYCDKIRTLTIGSGITKITQGSFKNVSQLRQVSINDVLDTKLIIEQGVFEDCD